MTLGEKIKKLRCDGGLTQDELAEILFVSRTAVSKWESGRGYPNIESLKALSEYFAVSLDNLLSNGELISIAEKEQYKRENRIKSTLFGLIDISMILLLFLPFFAQNQGDSIKEVSLISLIGIRPYLKTVYFAVVVLSVLSGILGLVMRNKTSKSGIMSAISLIIGTIAVTVFIISRQPYAAIFVFAFLGIKIFVSTQTVSSR